VLVCKRGTALLRTRVMTLGPVPIEITSDRAPGLSPRA
jgi:hypothetical protein